MQYKDYYKTLGVEREATPDQIKQAYRRLARKYHPDVSSEADAEEQFKTVGEAYEVLKDPEKRAAYDQLGNQWQSGQEFRPPPGWSPEFEFNEADSEVFSDFFESLFGRTQRGRRSAGGGFSARGRDQHARVEIELEDTFNGATRQITLQTPYIDENGHVHAQQRRLNMRIPKGVVQGQQIRLGGQGDPGLGGGAAGDLYLEIQFKPHRLYRIDGRDLYVDVPVAPWELALGAKVEVPTPTGKVSVTLPAGSQPGRKLRLSGKGIPGPKSGDQYVVLQAVVPPAESERQRQIYRDMEKELAFDPRHQLGV